ncbi:MAG: hypothetical protein U0667_17245 [Chloroflexota bacterium]
MVAVRHTPKAGAKLTGTEYEAADHHVVDALVDADIPATIARDSEVTAATHATISIANDAWPATCPSSLRWGIVVTDAQGRVEEVARGTLSVSPRTPGGVL